MSPASDRRLEDLQLSAVQEVGVRVGRVALDEDVVALGLHLLKTSRACMRADFLVVEGDVEGIRILDQAVVADDRDALVDRLLHGRRNRVGILGEDDQHIGALRDQVLDVGQLLLGRRLGVGRDVLGAGGVERRLDRRFVGLPALFLEVVPGHADDGLRRRSRGRQDEPGGRENGNDRSFQSYLPLPDETMGPATIAAHLTKVSRAASSRRNTAWLQCDFPRSAGGPQRGRISYSSTSVHGPSATESQNPARISLSPRPGSR